MIYPNNTIKGNSNNRIENKKLQMAILGALNYLEYAQYDKEKKNIINSENFNVTGSKKYFSVFLSKIRSYLGNYIIKQNHIEGAWPSFVSLLPVSGLKRLQPFFIALDYNHFTTVSTAFSLLFFDEENLPDNHRFVSKMLINASNATEHFKNGFAYNFWIRRLNKKDGYHYIAPINIPIWILKFRLRFNKLAEKMGFNSFYESEIIQAWIDKFYNPKINRTGCEALFNIPNDADNTSLSFSLKLLLSKQFSNSQFKPAIDDLMVFRRFRDLNRGKTDIHNRHLPKNTGAFLTWFKDENLSTFDTPGSGVLPLEANNIDLVVNSNVLLALALSGFKSFPGYNETISLISNSIKEKYWSKTCLYYPDVLWFPYAISRAVRDGGLQEQKIDEMLPELLKQVLEFEINEDNAQNYNIYENHPSEGINLLRTALKLSALLNFGEKKAEIAGMKKEFSETIDASVNYLLNNMRILDYSVKSNFLKPDKKFKVYWKSGVLFSSSVQQLAFWYSIPHTTSLVLEALTKYSLNYEKEIDNGSGLRLKLIIENNNLSLSI